MADVTRGILFVVSAPSGGGKSTLSRRVLGEAADLEFSVSYTTRPRREGEVDGRDYHFVDEATFERMVAADDFLEWAQVHDRRYGTARAASEDVLYRGRDLLLDIDVQGAHQIRQSGVDAVYVFVLPPDFETLRERLLARGREDGPEVHRRLSIAAREAAAFAEYDYLIVNDDLDRAVGDLHAVVRAERHRVLRRRAEADRILATIPRGTGVPGDVE